MMWVDHSLLIHSPADGHLTCSQFLETLNEVVADIYTQVFVWMLVSISLEQMLSCGTGGSHGKSVFQFIKETAQPFSKMVTPF